MAYQNRTYVPGELITAAILNTYLRDPLALVKTSISDDGTTWQGKLRALFTEQTITATGTQHDVSIAVGVTYLRCNNGSALTVTGFAVGGTAPLSGQTLLIDNVGAETVTLKHQDNGSTAEHRIICPGGADVTVAAGGRMLLLYDGTTNRWRAVFGGSEFVGGIKTDLISELTAAAGVTVDGVLLKDGAITLPGGQIAFPATQVPSSDPNTLDDYERGTWTPVIGGSGGESGQTYATQGGSYVKLGRAVALAFRVKLSAKGTITGNLCLKGLPFTPISTLCQVQVAWSGTAGTYVAVWIAMDGTTEAQIRGMTAATNNAFGGTFTAASINDDFEVRGNCFFIATA